MKNTSYHTSDGVAPARNVSSARTYTRTRVLSAGTLLNEQPSSAGNFDIVGDSFTIAPGGSTVKARLTADDKGVLEIRNAAGRVVISIESSPAAGDWRNTKNPTHWQQSAEDIFLNEGTYSVSGRVTNEPMSTPSANLAYFRYEVLTPYTVTDKEDEDKKKEPPTCDTCGCGTNSGNNTGNGKESTPDSPDEECGGAVSPSSAPRGGGAAPAVLAPADESESENASFTFLRYDSVRYWLAQVQDGVLTVLPTSGRSMTFALVSGDSEARPAATSAR